MLSALQCFVDCRPRWKDESSRTTKAWSGSPDKAPVSFFSLCLGMHIMTVSPKIFRGHACRKLSRTAKRVVMGTSESLPVCSMLHVALLSPVRGGLKPSVPCRAMDCYGFFGSNLALPGVTELSGRPSCNETSRFFKPLTQIPQPFKYSSMPHRTPQGKLLSSLRLHHKASELQYADVIFNPQLVGFRAGAAERAKFRKTPHWLVQVPVDSHPSAKRLLVELWTRNSIARSSFPVFRRHGSHGMSKSSPSALTERMRRTRGYTA